MGREVVVTGEVIKENPDGTKTSFGSGTLRYEEKDVQFGAMPHLGTLDLRELDFKEFAAWADAQCARVQDPREKVAMEIADHLIRGKGEERHGRGADFKDQPWVYLGRTFPGFLQGQASKKIDESMGMDPERAAKELVSAAGYLILAVLKLRGEV